ncbi:ABC transporter permease [Frankia sp. CiP3]|uniref:ABC transporter permease n=1 Tax=Frankia sp. CiP3 TaxID=2880971 RepID=UPI001EF415DB|nr:ABC transporter permease [Frankia sp. CiP3]
MAAERSSSAIRKLTAFDAVFRKELLINRRDPLLLIMMFAVPVVLIAFLGGAVGGAFGSSHPPAYVSAGPVDPALAHRLGAPQRLVSADEARQEVANGDIAVALVTDGAGHRTVIADPATPIVLSPFLAALDSQPPAVITPSGASYLSNSSPYAQTLPGFVMFHAFFGAAHAAQALHRERNWGTWNRLLSLPIGRFSLLVGKLLPIALMAMAQGLLLIGLGSLILGVPINNPGMFIVANVLIGLCLGAVGAAVAAIASNDLQVPQFNNLLVLLGGAVGGAMVPSVALPGWAQTIAPVFPQYWAMQMLKDTMTRSASMEKLLLDTGILAVFITVIFGIGFRCMRWERFRHA